MAPQSEPYYSSLGIKIPRHRGDHLRISGDSWLDDKREDDGAEGLWRIHDDLYDVMDFVKIHPGGSTWLELTKGTDITEAFEAHHISTRPENMLSKFHVRKAKTPRNSPFTFHENGFYKQLKKHVREEIKNTPDDLIKRSKIITDLLMLAYLATAVLSATWMNYYIGTLSGCILAMLATAAHNFFHQRDTFRMYYFDLTLLSSREWRISHILSHHLYTNTIIDLEIQICEPLLQYLPTKKTFFYRYVSWLYSPFFYFTLFIFSYIRRLLPVVQGVTIQLGKKDLIPFIAPTLMYILSGQSLANVMISWWWIITIGSFHYSLIGINAAHQRPDIFHDGDTPRSKQIDWGVAQLDTVMDRRDINGSHFLVLTNFGDHGLHHLFPAIDHGKLPYLYPIFKEMCAKYDVELRMTCQLDMIKGQFRQLANDTPNPFPPGYKKTSK